LEGWEGVECGFIVRKERRKKEWKIHCGEVWEVNEGVNVGWRWIGY